MTKKQVFIEFLPPTLWLAITIALFLTEYLNDQPVVLVQDPLLMTVGLALSVLGLIYLLWTGWFIFKPMFTKELVTGGSYRLARHPVYVAMYIALIGFGLLFFSWTWFVVLLAAIPFWFLICRAEETQMSELHGEAYLAYKNQTGMFFPKPIALSLLLSLVVLVALLAGAYIKYTDSDQLLELVEKDQPVLYLGMMVHVEGQFGDAEEEIFLDSHTATTLQFADIFDKYDAKATFEFDRYYIAGMLNWGGEMIQDLVDRGHGVGVHADVGGRAEQEGLDQNSFARILEQMKFDFEQASGVESRHVSGICSTLDWVDAAARAGFEFTTGGVAYCVMSMPEALRPASHRYCENPGKCHDMYPNLTEDRLHPWRVNTAANWLAEDPAGDLVILAPSGVLYSNAEELAGDAGQAGHGDFTKEDLDAFFILLDEALESVDPNKINTLYSSWSIGNAERVADPLLEEWLQRIEPYVEAGLVEWATLPEVYDYYLAWENELIDYSALDLSVEAGDDLVEIVEDIEYAEVDGVSLELDLYRPADVDGDLPLIIWTHGGGWVGGDKSDVAEMCKRLAMEDFVVASVNFRLSGDAIWPAQIHDIKAAVRWLRANADDYDLDPGRIGVIGSSSGGHLASMLGVTGGVEVLEGAVGDYENVSSRVSAVVDMFGPVNIHELVADCAGQCVIDHNIPESPESLLFDCPLSECMEEAELASVSTYITADDPPFLIIHGDEDSTIPIAQSMNLISDLEAAGIEAGFIKATGFAHSRVMFWEYTDQIIRFFNQHL